FRDLSRHQHGVRTELLSQDEAIELLTARLALSREHAQLGRDHHLQLAEQLGWHALAVSIAAAWLLTNGALDDRLVDKTADYLALLERQRARGRPFEDLKLPERDLNLEYSLQISYDRLAPDAQRRLRFIGAFAEARQFDVAAAAAVWDEHPDDAARGLNTLF